MRLNGCTKDLVVTGEGFGHRLRVPLPQGGGALHVGEQEGNRAGVRLCHPLCVLLSWENQLKHQGSKRPTLRASETQKSTISRSSTAFTGPPNAEPASVAVECPMACARSAALCGPYVSWTSKSAPLAFATTSGHGRVSTAKTATESARATRKPTHSRPWFIKKGVISVSPTTVGLPGTSSCQPRLFPNQPSAPGIVRSR